MPTDRLTLAYGICEAESLRLALLAEGASNEQVGSVQRLLLDLCTAWDAARPHRAPGEARKYLTEHAVELNRRFSGSETPSVTDDDSPF